MAPDLYVRAILSLLLVLGLVAGAAWAVRRFGAPGLIVRKGEPRRLGIIETLTIDAKRRLVLIRRDGTEHLLLLGAAQDLVVESRIPPTDRALAGDAS